MTLQEIITPWLNFISKRFAEKTNRYYRFLLNKHFKQFLIQKLEKYPQNLFLISNLKSNQKKRQNKH